MPFEWRTLRARARHKPRLAELSARLLQITLVQVGCWIDQLFADRWQRAPYRGPLIILGHQRSGTTFLHRALTCGTDGVGSTLAQMLMPALSLWNVGRAALRADEYCGGHLRDWIARRERSVTSGLASLHETSLGLVEEDEFFFRTLMASAMCANDCAASMDNRELDFLRNPDAWDQQRKQRIWAWYKQSLRKLAYFEQSHQRIRQRPWLVVKNPAFSSRIPELLANFPHARFIVLHREPGAAIASRLRLLQGIWNTFNQGCRLRPADVERIYQDSLRTYRGLALGVPLIPRERLLELSSQQLGKDPGGSLLEVNRRFGITGHATASDSAKSTPPRLEDFGLTRDRVNADLAVIVETRAWEWNGCPEP